MKQAIQNIISQFKTGRDCGMVKGDETLQELIGLLLTPKGIEHCTKYNLPTLEVIESIPPEELNSHPEVQVILNGGNCTAQPKEALVLIGDTNCHVEVSQLQDKATEIILLHGATLHLTATNYAVVQVTKAEGCEVSFTADETAKVVIL